ncbi:MAG TPA: hypothetical protein VGA37_06760 [Gemmatimonadales bacterium]
MRIALYLIFAVSGVAGLIYESIWARYLGLFVGHSAYAQVLVLAIFLGGMALGAILVARYTDKVPDPLLAYAGVELMLGVAAFGFHPAYLAVTQAAYDRVFPALAGTAMLTAVQWAIAGALILPQSILLGTTFPLMVAGALRRTALPPGKPIAWLYFANSFGAAVGVLLAGFWLLRLAGLPGTVLAAGMINVVVALTVYLVARSRPIVARVTAVPAVAVRQADGDAPDTTRWLRFLLLVSFGTAAASFMYEIGWLRMLALVLGTATHAFELMLSAFILGLALGAFWVRERADRWTNPLLALGAVQWSMGLLALATIPLYLASFGWTAHLMNTFARSDGGYAGFTVSRYVICLAIMLPSTFCAGMTLPLITRMLLGRGVGERAIGAVYGVNTLGSIVGVVVAGLIALPLLGLKGLLVLGATIDMGLGVWILFVVRGHNVSLRRLAVGSAMATAVITIASLLAPAFDTTVLASGVFRTGRLYGPGSVEMQFYRDGRTASVSVVRNVSDGRLVVATNGKSDASLAAAWLSACSDTTTKVPLRGDVSTQALAPLITLAHHPGARNAAVIGQGSGMSSHFLLGASNLATVVTIEIEPEMVAASRAFYPANRRVFDDPRSRIVMADAKAYFATRPEPFDLMVSEPSNPWVSGVASLFTSEFYERVTHYLADDGVFGQWVHLYEIDDGLVLNILAAIHQTFPAYEIFLTDGADMLVVATKAASLPSPDWGVIQRVSFASDMCHTVVPSAESLEAMRLTHRRALAPLLDGWRQPNSDFYPIFDLFGERARYLRRTASGFTGFATATFDFTAPFFGRRAGPSDALVPDLPGIPGVARRALGATLRVGVRDTVATAVTAGFRNEILRKQRWDAALAVDAPPVDWKMWLAEARLVEQGLHGGTRGYADTSFYEGAIAYVVRHGAPAVVRDVLEFRLAISRWQFDEASRAADALLSVVLREDGWISADELIEGGVVAKLRTGDVGGVVIFHRALAGRRSYGPEDLRAVLLDAYVAVAGGGR